MTTIAYSAVNIQTSEPSVPSIPDWFGDITGIAHHLQHHRVVAAIAEPVRLARRRGLSLGSHRFCRGALRLRRKR